MAAGVALTAARRLGREGGNGDFMAGAESPVIGGRLPALVLPACDGGPDIRLRAPGRLATVLVALHADCAPCDAYVAELAAQEPELRDWDGCVVVVRGASPPADGAPSDPARKTADSRAALHRTGDRMRAAADPDGRLTGAGIIAPAVLIADQWGELFAVEPADAAHHLLAPDEVIGWLRYLAVQCPECQGETR